MDKLRIAVVGYGNIGYFKDLKIHTKDEIENLALTVKDMERDLQDHEQNLTRIAAEKHGQFCSNEQQRDLRDPCSKQQQQKQLQMHLQKLKRKRSRANRCVAFWGSSFASLPTVAASRARFAVGAFPV